MSTITISKVGTEAVSTLQEIGRQTFKETFEQSNTAENMAHYLEEGFSLEKLHKELSDPNAAFYFAQEDGMTIGYLKLNFGHAQTELKDSKGVEIERIYVRKDFHGKKVGQLLYEKAVEVAKQQQANYIWLGVWEHNPRAISFYEKNGFVAFDKHIFKLGDDEQTDIMMRMEL